MPIVPLVHSYESRSVQGIDALAAGREPDLAEGVVVTEAEKLDA